MKTTLDHLPEKKKHQLRALAELIRAEAEVEMIILFGSFARGDAVEDPIGGYFSDIKKEGILIHDSGQFHLAEAKERTPADRKAQAQTWFDQWFESAVRERIAAMEPAPS